MQSRFLPNTKTYTVQIYVSLVIVTCHFSISNPLLRMSLDQATLRRILHLTVQRLRAPRQDAAALDGRKTYPKTRKTSDPIPIYVLNQMITPTHKPTYSTIQTYNLTYNSKSMYLPTGCEG